MTTLLPHQLEALEWMKGIESSEQRGGILALDTGMGKTLTMLSLIMSDPVGSSLIICPKSLIHTWKDECEKRLCIGSDQISIYSASSNSLAKTKIVISTYPVLKTKKHKLYKRIWTRVILDEAHIIRNNKTKMFESVKKLVAIKYWCVTATPINNYLEDVLSLCQFIGDAPYDTKVFWIIAKNERLKISLKNWRQKYLFIRNKQILNLKPIRTEYLELELSKGEQKIYDEYKDEAIDVYKKWILGEKSIINVFISLLRLRQVADHYLLPISNLTTECIACRSATRKVSLNCETHGICKDCSRLDKKFNQKENCQLCEGFKNLSLETRRRSTKLSALVELVKKLVSEGEQKIVIFSQWTSMLDLTQEALESEGYSWTRLDGTMSDQTRKENLESFTLGDKTIFLVSIGCGSLGLNLFVSRIVILLEPHYNPFVEKQAFDRLHRIGQEKEVIVYRLIIKDSIESKILDTQKGKKALSRTVLGTEVRRTSGLTKNDLDNLLNKISG